MTIVIHGLIQSTRTQRVLLLCHELELHFELKNVEMMEGEHKVIGPYVNSDFPANDRAD